MSPWSGRLDVHNSVCYHQSRSRGSRLNIIIVAEGAIDRQGQHITSDFVKDVSRAQSLTDAEGKPEAGPADGNQCV